MLLRHRVAEAAIRLAARTMPSPADVPGDPASIFVLRNNDIGDLLVVTPLFEALRNRFPQAHIVAGVGAWNAETLKLNPYVSEVLPVSAPWHNKARMPFRWWQAVRYILFSQESRNVAGRRFDVGIDVLGSHWGSLLMIRARIPYRLGVCGYAGGHAGVQQYVQYDENEHVGRAALRFAEMLGATKLPPCRPQVFLSASEREDGERRWSSGLKARIAIGPGGGFPEKCWPPDRSISLTRQVATLPEVDIVITGSRRERVLGDQLAATSPLVRNFVGKLTLRETFAVVAAADLVVCNPSMLMHAAAAFSIPTVVLLGDWYRSAEQHAAQWGYPGTCLCLGKNDGSADMATPRAALENVRERLAVHRHQQSSWSSRP